MKRHDHHPRVADEQQAAVNINKPLHLGCWVRVSVGKEISLLLFLSSPWKVHVYATGVVENTFNFSCILFPGRCNTAHYFFSLHWNSPAGRNVMRNVLL